MASTYYFISAPGTSEVTDWFKAQPESPEEYQKESGTVLYFRELGKLMPDGQGGFDLSQSPVVAIWEPQQRRHALWTVGEVHFLAKNAPTTLPDFDRLRRRFVKWLKQQPVVWESGQDGHEGHGYYFEGGIRSEADAIYGFPTGRLALQAGRYFVAEGANESVLDKLCKALRLRGVDCECG